MDDLDRLEQWLSGGSLLRPDAAAPSIIDLAAVIARACGVRQEQPASSAQLSVQRHIGEAEHLVFVLVDGFGTNLLERLPPDSFFRRKCALTLRTVFPSSTAPALTSFATGQWPAEHGVPGWFMYLRERQRSILTLPFVERDSAIDARTLQVNSAEVFAVDPQTAAFMHSRQWVMPKNLINSVFTTYSCGGAAQLEYSTLDIAIERINDIVLRAKAPTYTYWYIPDVDYVEHVKGASHPDVLRVLLRVERAVEALGDVLRQRAGIVVTADHGQIDIPDEERHILTADDPLLRHLLAPPSCEPRVPAFHVLPHALDGFADEFRARFGHTWVLLTIDEVDELRLFGPEPLSVLTRDRLGDYLALNATHEMIVTPAKGAPLVGSHGGLLPDEMLVPLIVA